MFAAAAGEERGVDVLLQNHLVMETGTALELDPGWSCDGTQLQAPFMS